MSYLLHLVIYLNLYIIVALSLNLVVGYCGLITLAHAGYFAIGAYAYALGALKLGWSFFPALGLGVVTAMLLSLALSLPAWRFKRDVFVMVSLAVQAMLFGLIYNWYRPDSPLGSWFNFTNGPYGLSGVPKPAIAGSRIATVGSFAAFSFVVAGVCALLVWTLARSPWGRLLKAIRDDELAARGLGKNVRLAKVQVVAIACGIVAVGGSMYAAYVSYVEPSIAALDFSILMLSMVIVGGVGNFRGPVIGAFVLLLIPEILRFVAIPDAVAPDIRTMAYGLLLVVFMHVRPKGIWGEYRLD
jgi:branched-chain amino acid transport system permease protein